MTRSLLLTIVFPFISCVAASYPSYANAFVDPSYALSKNWSKNTIFAQRAILEWADGISEEGPWTVTSKTIEPPSNDTHDYLSWAPYLWPDCSKVGNTTELSPEQVWVTCPYVDRDGQFNPDQRLVNDTGAFQALSDAVFANALAWAINGSDAYAANVAKFVNVWFVAPETRMNPNLMYAQLTRGPGEQTGSHYGILDLKCMAKVASAVLIMRQGNATAWTSEIDEGLVSWTNQYMNWLTTDKEGHDEMTTPNNHGSFYFTQLAALKLIVNDKPGAVSTVQQYLNGIYENQITANGSQPFELARTRPFHYLAYNLAAVITSAKIAQYAGYNAWNTSTTQGGTVPLAAKFAMSYPVGNGQADELWPQIASVAAVYGDPEGDSVSYLKQQEVDYATEPWFFYEQPLSDSGYLDSQPANSTNVNSRTNNQSASGAARRTAGLAVLLLSLLGLFLM